MALQGVVGFLGLDDLSLDLAASLLRSGYAVQAFEVHFYFSILFISSLVNELMFGSFELPGKSSGKVIPNPFPS
ncbi:hypothetical protein CJ030_MR5G025029 [Morella rubra]|uniref:Uncharacterized protein n=1 Tax=Morella rubra TaxID=262757 RepID=A0A6A1VHM6_9ROSI|nr:hypothetical protein CJ030_MR5G025029 [Morella rubra]